MKIHVINCGWLRPLGGRLWDRRSTGLGPARLACRCLLILTETDGPILVDTGVSPADLAEPGRLPGLFRIMDRPEVAPHASAAARLHALGVAPESVRHVVMTHLDFDHAGGLSDFPAAAIHVTRREAGAAQSRQGTKARLRWRPSQWPHDFTEHESPGEAFHGQATIGGLPGGLRFLPLPGHSPGHAGVLVPAEDGWVLHAGDAIFDLRELDEPAQVPPLARAYAAFMQSDAAQRHASAASLRRLARDNAEALTVLCTHDPVLPETHRWSAEAWAND